MNENGPGHTINPNIVDDLDMEELFTWKEIEDRKKKLKESVIRFNKSCWKAWCERNGVEF